MRDCKYIRFEEVTTKRKTGVWNVIAKRDDFILGKIEYYTGWRGYIFVPTLETETIFEATCLTDIADFIREKNTERGSKGGKA